MTGCWLYADRGHALPAHVAPVPVGCDEVLPSNAEGAQVRKHRADQHGTRAAACDNRVQIADHFGCYRAAERGEHTERCANRRSLLIERSPTPAERQSKTRRVRKAPRSAPTMSRSIPWEWRRARGAISRRIALQPVHFHIERTREWRYLVLHVRPRTTREAGAK